MNNNISTQPVSKQKELKNLVWHEDDCGAYWVGDVYIDGKKHHVTGSYYNLMENGRRLEKWEQVTEY